MKATHLIAAVALVAPGIQVPPQAKADEMLISPPEVEASRHIASRSGDSMPAHSAKPNVYIFEETLAYAADHEMQIFVKTGYVVTAPAIQAVACTSEAR